MFGLATILTMPVTVTWRGYVLSVLWRWFIVPTFGMSPISVPAALGVSLIVGYLTFHYDGRIEDKRSAADKFCTGLGVSLVAPAFALLMGWIIRAFM